MAAIATPASADAGTTQRRTSCRRRVPPATAKPKSTHNGSATLPPAFSVLRKAGAEGTESFTQLTIAPHQD